MLPSLLAAQLDRITPRAVQGLSSTARACLATFIGSFVLIFLVLVLAIIEKDYLSWKRRGDRLEATKTIQQPLERRSWIALPLALLIVLIRLGGLVVRHLVYSCVSLLADGKLLERAYRGTLQWSVVTVEFCATKVAFVVDQITVMLAPLQPIAKRWISTGFKLTRSSVPYLRFGFERTAQYLAKATNLFLDLLTHFLRWSRPIARSLLEENIIELIRTVELLAHVVSVYLIPWFRMTYEFGTLCYIKLRPYLVQCNILIEPIAWLLFGLVKAASFGGRYMYPFLSMFGQKLQPVWNTIFPSVQSLLQELPGPMEYAMKGTINDANRYALQLAIPVIRLVVLTTHRGRIILPPIMKRVWSVLETSFYLHLHLFRRISHSTLAYELWAWLTSVNQNLVSPILDNLVSTYPIISSFTFQVKTLVLETVDSIQSTTTRTISRLQSEADQMMKTMLVQDHHPPS